MARIDWNVVLHIMQLKWLPRRILSGLAGAGIVIAVLFSIAFIFLTTLINSPLPERIIDKSAVSFVLHNTFGEEIGVRGQHKRPVDIAVLPAHTVAAFVAIEDRRFYQHHGVDILGIIRALRENYRAQNIVEGGSTITQQLVKNVYLNSERTLQRKLDEAIVALKLEKVKSKPEILEDYLYTVYFGNNAYGIEAAAQTYFRKNASDLSIAESALLAGSIKAPGKHAPHLDPAYASNRARLVLDAMTETGSLSLLDAELATYELAALKTYSRELSPEGYFLDYAVTESRSESTSQEIVHLYTTLHPQYQAIAENALAEILTENVMAKNSVTQAAIVVMRPTGEIIAMIGGRDYTTSQFNRATQAQRQPGSLFKTFVYDAAFRQGWRIEDLIVDTPLILETPNSRDEYYKPANYNDRYYGVISTRQAFAKSANASALRLQEWAGRDNVIQAARRTGLDAELQPFASLGLGVNETSLLDMTSAYASIAASRVIEPFVDHQSRPAPLTHGGEASPALLQLLFNNVQSGTGYAARLNVPAFGKTGTTQDHRDAWFVGFTDHLIVGVWLGNDNYTPMKNVTGGTLPAQIWKSFMIEANKELQKEGNPARFSRRPLLDIALDAQEEDDPFGWGVAPAQRILGPATMNYDGSLDMGGIRIHLDGIRIVSGYGSYRNLYEELDNFFDGRELTCEISHRYSSCFNDTIDVSEYMIEQGWARTSYRAAGYLRRAEQRARQARNGIWSKQNRNPNPRYEYYDMRDLTQQQRRQLERQREREAEHLQRMQELQQQRTENSIVIGRSAIGEEPTGGQINRQNGRLGVSEGVTGIVASDSGL